MDELPHPILVDILARLPDFAHIARCRTASKAINAAASDVPDLNLVCSSRRRSVFKAAAAALILRRPLLRSLSLSFEDPFPAEEVLDSDSEADSDDLHLSSPDFLAQWLPHVAHGLSSLSIEDFWPQSCCRRSSVLGLISTCCENLLELELKNAWLSVEGLKMLPKLTSLTLEFIRLDDENLTKLNECFPSLQTLNLLGVGGLKEPKVCLTQLKTCHCTVSNVPVSLEIDAPMLTTLKLLCIKPQKVVIKAPVLSKFHLFMVEPIQLEVVEFKKLTHVRIKCSNLHKLMLLFPVGTTVKSLVLESQEKETIDGNLQLLRIEKLTIIFPNLETLVVGPWAWLEMQKSLGSGCSDSVMKTPGWHKLKTLKVKLFVLSVDDAYEFLSYVVNRLCSSSMKDVQVAIRGDGIVLDAFIVKCHLQIANSLDWRFTKWDEFEEEL